jgi:dihydrofolate reductase
LHQGKIDNLYLIVAMANNNVIGINGTLPWNLSEDLQHFRQQTTSHVIIMGRKTFESIGRCLPNRKNIIITRQKDYNVPGAQIASSLEHAISLAQGVDKIFVIGGGEIYNQAINVANHLIVTMIELDARGDAFFPVIGPEWNTVSVKSAVSANGINFSIRHLTREKLQEISAL